MNQPHRRRARLAIAIVAAAAIITIGAVSYQEISPITTGPQYAVTFQQRGACSPAMYTIPWSLTLGSRTEAEPTNATLPIPNGSYGAGAEPPSLYTIVFTSVADGVYHYEVAPSDAFDQASGIITVNGTSQLVPVDGPIISCTATVTS